MIFLSEGIKAYHWAQFDIPAGELEILPEVSEERMMKILRSNVRQQGKNSQQTLTVTDVTVSCKYEQSRLCN